MQLRGSGGGRGGGSPGGRGPAGATPRSAPRRGRTAVSAEVPMWAFGDDEDSRHGAHADRSKRGGVGPDPTCHIVKSVNVRETRSQRDRFVDGDVGFFRVREAFFDAFCRFLDGREDEGLFGF